MFTTETRDRLRLQLTKRAEADERCAAAALLGSAARGDEDAWSDIDFAIRLIPGADSATVLADWSRWLTSVADVGDQLDIRADGAVYRVFLCDDSLQVDLSIWPWDAFRATNGEPMRLLFGDSLEPEPVSPRDWAYHARMGWLYGLHARSAVARGRNLQADLMLTSWRQAVMTMACIRLGLDSIHGRAVHLLPTDLQFAVTEAHPPTLSSEDLATSLVRMAEIYLDEVARNDAAYAARLGKALRSLISISTVPPAR